MSDRTQNRWTRRPRRACTVERQIESLVPVPLDFLAKNGMNRRPAFSAENPIAVHARSTCRQKKAGAPLPAQCCRGTLAGRISEIRDLVTRHEQSVPGLRQARLEHFKEIRQFDCPHGGRRTRFPAATPLETPVKSAQNRTNHGNLVRAILPTRAHHFRLATYNLCELPQSHVTSPRSQLAGIRSDIDRPIERAAADRRR
jgi:hypothetical protein